MAAEEHNRLADAEAATETAASTAPDAPEQEQVWRMTDWTVWQRQRAVVGFFLVASACGLLAGALTEWRTTPWAPDLIAPVALTLLCLGIGLVDWVYWYPYQQAGFRPGVLVYHLEHMASFMKLAVVVAVWTLGMQVILAPWATSPAWWGLSAAAYLPPCMIAFVATGGTLGFGSMLSWTPPRAANRSGGAWTPSPRDPRLLLRWLGMLVATRGGILYLAPMLLLISGDLSLTTGSADSFVPTVTYPYLILIALLFALVTLSELSIWATSRASAPR